MSQELSYSPLPQQNSLTQIESSRAVQEVQAAMIIAKRFPRDQKAALDRIINACTRPGLANAAVYQYSRGGSNVSGPSIRLAEALAQEWQNLQFGIRELDQSNGESTVEAFAWDVENNTRQTKTFQVPHVRYSKSKGNTKLTDPRDIYELVANNGARRLRTCILGVIPGDIVEAALEQCELTMSATADNSPEAQAKIIGAFEKYGVTKEQIEKRIQRRMDAITPAQVVGLRKIMTSLKDGMSKPEEWFEKAPQTSNLAEIAKGGQKDSFPVDQTPETSAETVRRNLTHDSISETEYLAALKFMKLSSAPEFKLVSEGEHKTALVRWEEVQNTVLDGRDAV